MVDHSILYLFLGKPISKCVGRGSNLKKLMVNQDPLPLYKTLGTACHGMLLLKINSTCREGLR